jgi:hypothetical protein
MCYEQRVFRAWWSRKAQKRSESEHPVERTEPATSQARETVHPQPARDKKPERELEEVQ